MLKRARNIALGVGIVAIAWSLSAEPWAQQGPSGRDRGPVHGKTAARLLIKNAMIIRGNATPAFGPVDLLVEGGLISRVGRVNSEEVRPDAVIDGTGKYVMPGMINTHMHWQEEREPSIPQPIQYERNLYLAAGVTTTREVGGNFAKSKQWQAESAANRIVAPRMYVYFAIRPDSGLYLSPPKGEKRPDYTPEEIRALVREAKQKGADGIKTGGVSRRQLEALLDEAHKVGIPVTTHMGVEETTAKDYIELGARSIEHFYGVADAAIDGVQNFPQEMNYANELHRFARAGELYTQANPEKLKAIVELMAEKNVAWSPTMVCYVASRDLIRAQNVPWFKDYLHPSAEEYFKADLNRHMSYFFEWTNTLEVQWQRNYRVWLDTLLHFARSGGLVTVGDDAGWSYNLYGFGYIRELELHEEAGFHPLEVLKHATVNGAELLGLGDRLGRVTQGYMADLLVVNGNPLKNLRVLNPYGVDMMVLDGKPLPLDGSAYNPFDPGVKSVHGGGIEWTIKDGIPYHVPTLMKEVKELVAKARAERRPETSAARP